MSQEIDQHMLSSFACVFDFVGNMSCWFSVTRASGEKQKSQGQRARPLRAARAERLLLQRSQLGPFRVARLRSVAPKLLTVPHLVSTFLVSRSNTRTKGVHLSEKLPYAGCLFCRDPPPNKLWFSLGVPLKPLEKGDRSTFFWSLLHHHGFLQNSAN